jgi:hypothetical protein
MLSYDTAVTLYRLTEELHDRSGYDVTRTVYLRPNGEE